MIATRSRTVTFVALAILLVGGGCTSGIDLLGDGDRDVVPTADADGGAEDHADVDVAAEAEAEVDTGADADDGDAVADEGDTDAGTCVDGWYDPTSGLCWEDPPGGTTRSWDDAVTYCDGLSLGSYGPGSWHLPTISESRSLIRGCPDVMTGGRCALTDSCLDMACRLPGCDSCASLAGPGAGGCYWDPALSGACDRYYWTSSCLPGEIRAWGVRFEYATLSHINPARGYYVRCVRPGP
jgi:hypothetical protein